MMQGPSPGRLGSPLVSVPLPLPLPLPVPETESQSQRQSQALLRLPPHRRAHTLLQEMAALSSRLAQLSGNKAWQVGPGKGTIPTFLPGSSISLEGLAATSMKEVLALIESHQSLLSEAISEISELQEIEQEKQRIAGLIAVKDTAMRNFAKRLRDAEQVLEHTIEDFEDYKRPKRISKEENNNLEEEEGGAVFGTGGAIDINEMIAYAHRISYTTFAPPEFASGLVPLRGAFPPGPQEEQMRASQLYSASGLDIGLPKPALSALSPPIEGSIEPSIDIAQGRVLPSIPLPTSIPQGWRPGMPVELPKDLPLPPPGWKPGDPIPLPPGMEMPAMPPGWKPGDAIVLPIPVGGSAPKPQEPATRVAPSLQSLPPTLPGVIQVPFVQLDLNPELEEDYGSDYSDEDGSSEEDED